jgi:hypothetical protein
MEMVSESGDVMEMMREDEGELEETEEEVNPLIPV